MANKPKLIIASDHAGFQLKSELLHMLQEEGYTVEDLGPNSDDSVDYPDYAHPLAEKVEQGEADMGILMCGSANGIAMAANKHAHIRAAITWSEEIAELARSHNNANVICLPARYINTEQAKKMLRTFLKTPFDGGRHERRVNKIKASSQEKV